MQITNRSNTPEAFQNLHTGYHGRLLNSMTAMVRDRDAAEDITATAFAKALTHLDSFRGESSLYTWLHNIAVNEALHWRRDGHLSLEQVNEAQLVAPVSQSADRSTGEEREDAEEVRRALRQVPQKYRQVLADHFIHGYSMKQIARRYRIPLGTALSRMFTAKRLLRRAWEESR
jgi:RNA polymerase sigma-70 factor, ECF subfamily